MTNDILKNNLDSNQFVETNSPISNKKSLLIILLIISIFLVLLVITLFIYFGFQFNEPKIESFDNLRVLAKTQDSSSCKDIKDETLRKECFFISIFSEASENLDYKICEKSEDENFVNYCKEEIILESVVREYVKESREKNLTDVVPFNLDLCEEISDEKSREFCKNPQYILKSCYNLWCYEVEEW
jgi:hypothetical protein